MAQIFDRKADKRLRAAGWSLFGLALAGFAFLLLAGNHPSRHGVGEAPEQPMPFSHARHVGELGLDEQRWPARQATWFINGQKDEGLRARHMDANGDLFAQTMQKIYYGYEEACERGGLVDFNEMLLRVLELFRDNEGLRGHYQRRFRHILVDEFQDTNSIQYAWLRLLANDDNAVTIVGDDDQSIYGWRGAKIENIHKFSRDFPDTRTIRLEQNYRSTKTILQASNELISNNTERMGKELWTDGNDGEPISVYSAYNVVPGGSLARAPWLGLLARAPGSGSQNNTNKTIRGEDRSGTGGKFDYGGAYQSHHSPCVPSSRPRPSGTAPRSCSPATRRFPAGPTA